MPKKKTDKSRVNKLNIWALLGFLFSLVGITSLGILSIFGIVFSIIGLVQIKNSGERGKSLAITGLVIGIVMFIVLIGIIIGLGWLTLFLSLNTAAGSGNVISQDYNLTGFNAVEINGQGELFIVQQENWTVSIEAEDNILENLDVRIENGMLIVEKRGAGFFRNTKPIKIYVGLPEINEIKINGFGSINSLEVIAAENLSLAIAGSGAINFILDVTELDLVLSGSGEANLKGKADRQELTISGSGNIKAFDLQTKETKISIFGSGDVDVFAEEILNVVISGSGNVLYKGSPSVSQTIYGSGKVSSVK